MRSNEQSSHTLTPFSESSRLFSGSTNVPPPSASTSGRPDCTERVGAELFGGDRAVECLDDAEGEYMVTSGTHFNSGCCFDYGNAETNSFDDGNGTMEAIYFGNNTSGIGVASSANPIADFKDAKGSYLVNGSTPGASGTSSWLFDPGVLIDDDGQAYLSFGGNGENNPRIIKLGPSLTSVSGSAAALSAANFFEASFLF